MFPQCFCFRQAHRLGACNGKSCTARRRLSATLDNQWLAVFASIIAVIIGRCASHYDNWTFVAARFRHITPGAWRALRAIRHHVSCAGPCSIAHTTYRIPAKLRGNLIYCGDGVAGSSTSPSVTGRVCQRRCRGVTRSAGSPTAAVPNLSDLYLTAGIGFVGCTPARPSTDLGSRRPISISTLAQTSILKPHPLFNGLASLRRSTRR